MFQRKAVNPGGDGRKGDGARADLRGDLQRGAVAGGEQRRLVLAAAVPHRADAVDDVVGLEVEALGVHRLPGRAAADPGAGLAKVLPHCKVEDRKSGGSAKRGFVRVDMSRSRIPTTKIQ